MKFLLLVLVTLLSISFSLSQPSVPTNLSISEVNIGGQKQIYLKWEHPDSVTYYDVYRKNGSVTDTGIFVKRNINPYYTVKHFYDNYIVNGGIYTFYVVARNSGGQSLPSEKVQLTISNLPLTGVIKGKILTDTANAFLSGAHVYLHPQGANYQYYFTSYQSGDYFFNVNPGTYYMHAAKQGYVTEFFENVPDLQSATPIQLSRGDTISINISLAPVIPLPEYWVKGSVKDSIGNPLKALVTFYKVKWNSFQIPDKQIFTDSLGEFSVKYKLGDTLVIYASTTISNYYSEYFSRKTTFIDADKVVIKGDADTINFNLREKLLISSGETISHKPEGFTVYQNYPNPFNPSTNISYYLEANSDVKISITNILGQEVYETSTVNQSPGFHSFTFTGNNLSSGVYYYTITTISGNHIFTNTKKMLLSK